MNDIVKKDQPWLWTKGQSGNPAGKPKGLKEFKTVFKEALEKIAASENIDAGDKILVDVVVEGIKRARKGDFRFYQDTLDRAMGPVNAKKDEANVHLTQINLLDPERAEHIRRIANIHDDQEGSR